MFYYRSPSQSIHIKVLCPSRDICRKVLCDKESVLRYYQEILEMTSLVCSLVVYEPSQSLDGLKKTVQLGEEEREKLPNHHVVKYLFEHRVLDHLVFLVLNYSH